MSFSDIKTLGYRIYDAFNARDIAAAEELFAPDFISHAMGTVGGLRETLTRLFTRYPDHHVVVEDALVEGDRFALRVTVHGIPGTSEQSLPTMIEFFRTENGKVVEVWGAGSGFPPRHLDG
jgi:predicted SnoaL-like aldol condensation-catalyzing enzyme